MSCFAYGKNAGSLYWLISVEFDSKFKIVW